MAYSDNLEHNADDIKQCINTLIPAGALFEIRCISKGIKSVILRNDGDNQLAVDYITGTCTGDNDQFYMSVQQLRDDLFTTERIVKKYGKKFTHNKALREHYRESKGNYNCSMIHAENGSCVSADGKDFTQYNWLFFDFDPVKAESKQSATQEESDRAKRASEKFISDMTELGFGKPYYACSGNGYHVAYRVAVSIEVQSDVAKLYECLKAKYADDDLFVGKVEFDTSGSSYAHIFKIAGAVARKGEHTAERPHRVSYIIDTGDGVINDCQLFKPVVEQYKDKIGKKFKNAALPVVKLDVSGGAVYTGKTLTNFLMFAQTRGIPVLKDTGIDTHKPTGREYHGYLIECPFKDKHSDHKDDSLLVMCFTDNQEIMVNCFHVNHAGFSFTTTDVIDHFNEPYINGIIAAVNADTTLKQPALKAKYTLDWLENMSLLVNDYDLDRIGKSVVSLLIAKRAGGREFNKRLNRLIADKKAETYDREQRTKQAAIDAAIDAAANDMEAINQAELSAEESAKEVAKIQEEKEKKVSEIEQQQVKTLSLIYVGDDIAKRNPENYRRLMEFYGYSVKFNVLTRFTDIYYKGKLQPPDTSFDCFVTDVTALAEKHGFALTDNNTYSQLNNIATKNRYNPVADYLAENHAKYKSIGTKLDNYTEIDKMFSAFKFQSNTNIPLCRKLFFKWLVSGYRIAFNRGATSTQGVLVLQGPQNIRKTTWGRKILPNPDWYIEGESLDPKDKDSIEKCTTNWLLELGELGQTLNKNQVNALKAYINRPHDIYRPAYGRKRERFNRHTFILGTINDDTFLKDDTGNRRYWVFPLDNIDWPTVESVNIDLMWAEVAELANTDFSHGLSSEEVAELADFNANFSKMYSEEIILTDVMDFTLPVERWQRISITEIKSSVDSLRNTDATRIGRAIKALKNKFPDIQDPTSHANRKYLLPPVHDVEGYTDYLTRVSEASKQYDRQIVDLKEQCRMSQNYAQCGADDTNSSETESKLYQYRQGNLKRIESVLNSNDTTDKQIDTLKGEFETSEQDLISQYGEIAKKSTSGIIIREYANKVKQIDSTKYKIPQGKQYEIDKLKNEVKKKMNEYPTNLEFSSLGRQTKTFENLIENTKQESWKYVLSVLDTPDDAYTKFDTLWKRCETLTDKQDFMQDIEYKRLKDNSRILFKYLSRLSEIWTEYQKAVNR